jgi:hypothetical protein
MNHQSTVAEEYPTIKPVKFVEIYILRFIFVSQALIPYKESIA